MSSLKHVFFFNRKLNYWNYHDTKKLTVGQKISFTRSISLHVIKMSQNLLNFWICSVMRWFHGMKMKTLYWSWIKKSTIAKQKWNEQKTSYISKISKDIFHLVLFKNEGTSTLRTSLKKNILEKHAAYIFILYVTKTFKIRNGLQSQSQMS